MQLAHPFEPSVMSLLVISAFMSLVTFIKATVLETVILWFLKWGSFLRSLLAASIVNLATTILGFAISTFTFSWEQFNEPVFTLKGILLWGVFVAIEGGLLALIDKKPLRKSLMASCIMNAGNYVLLYLLPLMLLSLHY